MGDHNAGAYERSCQSMVPVELMLFAPMSGHLSTFMGNMIGNGEIRVCISARAQPLGNVQARAEVMNSTGRCMLSWHLVACCRLRVPDTRRTRSTEIGGRMRQRRVAHCVCGPRRGSS